MKNIYLTNIFLLLCMLPFSWAFAQDFEGLIAIKTEDIYETQPQANLTTELRMYIKDSLIRANIPGSELSGQGEVEVIYNRYSGEYLLLTTINGELNAVRKSTDQSYDYVKLVEGKDLRLPEPPDYSKKIVESGEYSKISGVAVKKVVRESEAYPGEAWVAQNFQVDLGDLLVLVRMKDPIDEIWGVKGFLMSLNHEDLITKKTRLVTTVIEEKSVDDSVFELQPGTIYVDLLKRDRLLEELQNVGTDVKEVRRLMQEMSSVQTIVEE